MNLATQNDMTKWLSLLQEESKASEDASSDPRLTHPSQVGE